MDSCPGVPADSLSNLVQFYDFLKWMTEGHAYIFHLVYRKDRRKIVYRKGQAEILFFKKQSGHFFFSESFNQLLHYYYFYCSLGSYNPTNRIKPGCVCT